MFIAHRGLVKKGVVENTLPAFLNAIKSNKYAGFELDVYTSKDKVFVVHHDPIVNGKFIWKQTYKELRKSGIIKLVDVLKLSTDKIILIDIKDINLDINKFTKLLNKYKDKNRYVMSFFNSVIKKFKNPTFKVGVLNFVLNLVFFAFVHLSILYFVKPFHLFQKLLCYTIFFDFVNLKYFLFGLKLLLFFL